MQVSAKYIQFQMTEYCYMTTLFNSEAETLLHSAPSSGRHGFSPAWLFNRSLPLLSIFNIDLKQITVNNSSSCSLVTQQSPGLSTRCSGREKKTKPATGHSRVPAKKKQSQNMQGKIIQKSQLFRGFQEPSLPVFLEPFLVTLPSVRLVAETLIDEQRTGVLLRYSVHCAGFSRLS